MFYCLEATGYALFLVVSSNQSRPYYPAGRNRGSYSGDSAEALRDLFLDSTQSPGVASARVVERTAANGVVPLGKVILNDTRNWVDLTGVTGYECSGQRANQPSNER